MHRHRTLGALLLAAHVATACDRSQSPPERGQLKPEAARIHETALPLDVRLACDSAAAMAGRAGARRVRLVADTVDATPSRGCAVIVDSLPDSRAVRSAVFQKGFPGGTWRLNLFETADPELDYAVWRPTIFCDVAIIHSGKESSNGESRGAVQRFDIFCVPQTPNDTPRVAPPLAP